MSTLTKDITKKLDSLPASSPAVTKLINIIDDPQTTRLEIMHLLALDQVLFANAFKYANSAAMGNCRRMESLTEIVDVLGFNILKNIAVLTALHNVCQNKQLWFDGIFVAHASKRIALKLGNHQETAEEIFMAVMLQQYGLFALAHFDEEKFTKINLKQNFYDRLKQETELFGYHHLELSILVLEQWGLPSNVLCIVANQEDQENSKVTPYNRIIDLAHELLIFGPIEEKEQLESFCERNEELIEELKVTLDLKLIESIVDETRELMSI
ncbi:MAG: HDOD domain-containing protein [Candidatus Melainabacteria bacterium]|nr:HDOD domain-containing protein [Candidatus Melainabacteria bacterium]